MTVGFRFTRVFIAVVGSKLQLEAGLPVRSTDHRYRVLPLSATYVHNVHEMNKASVNVAELRGHLSTYLKRVRQGEEILIRDRNVAIARLVPLSGAEDFEEGIQELATQGLVKLPDESLDLNRLLAMPAPEFDIDKLRAAIEAEREED